MHTHTHTPPPPPSPVWPRPSSTATPEEEEAAWAPLGPASSISVAMGTASGALMTSSMQVSSRSATRGRLETGSKQRRERRHLYYIFQTNGILLMESHDEWMWNSPLAATGEPWVLQLPSICTPFGNKSLEVIFKVHSDSTYKCVVTLFEDWRETVYKRTKKWQTLWTDPFLLFEYRCKQCQFLAPLTKWLHFKRFSGQWAIKHMKKQNHESLLSVNRALPLKPTYALQDKNIHNLAANLSD